MDKRKNLKTIENINKKLIKFFAIIYFKTLLQKKRKKKDLNVI